MNKLFYRPLLTAGAVALAVSVSILAACQKTALSPETQIIRDTVILRQTDTVTVVDTVAIIPEDFAAELIDFSRCRVLNLPGDAMPDEDNHYTPPVYMNGDELFDGKWMDGYQRWDQVGYHYFGWMVESDKPWFTFDIGEYAKLYSMTLMPYWGMITHDAAVFEVWAYTADGPVPQTTPEDWKADSCWVRIAYADATELGYKVEALRENPDLVGNPVYDPCVEGVSVMFGDTLGCIPVARYYRFCLLENFIIAQGPESENMWNAVYTFTASELRLWKYSSRTPSTDEPQQDYEPSPSKCRDLMLYYCGGPQRNNSNLPYFKDYLISDEEQPRWLFDGALLLDMHYSEDYTYMDGYGRKPCKKEHIEYLWNTWFNTILPRLDNSVKECKKLVNTPMEKEKVVLMLCVMPYPESYPEWGKVSGVDCSDWTVWENNLSAYKWQMNQLESRFKQSGFENLELVGFYWPAEDGGYAVRHMADIGDYARSKKLPLYFIPFFSESFVPMLYSKWKMYNFDYCYLQPNYFFYDVPRTRLERACELASKYGMDMEFEFAPYSYSDDRAYRMADYMDVFDEYGVFDNCNLAYYQCVSDFSLLKGEKGDDDYRYSLYCRLSDYVAKRHEAFYGSAE